MVEVDLGPPAVQIGSHWVWRARKDPGHRCLRELITTKLATPLAALAPAARAGAKAADLRFDAAQTNCRRIATIVHWEKT